MIWKFACLPGRACVTGVHLSSQMHLCMQLPAASDTLALHARCHVMSCDLPSLWYVSKAFLNASSTAQRSRDVRHHEVLVQEPSLSLVFEYAEHDLFEMVRAYRERTAVPSTGFSTYTLKSLMRQLTAGTQALHAASIMHRDLKPSNVLVMGEGSLQGQVKIADFGLARCMRIHLLCCAIMPCAIISSQVKANPAPSMQNFTPCTDQPTQHASLPLPSHDSIRHRHCRVGIAARAWQIAHTGHICLLCARCLTTAWSSPYGTAPRSCCWGPSTTQRL